MRSWEGFLHAAATHVTRSRALNTDTMRGNAVAILRNIVNSTPDVSEEQCSRWFGPD